jgi:hypothetical protein
MESNNLRKLTPKLDGIKTELINFIRQSKIPIIYENYANIFIPRIQRITRNPEFINMIERIPTFNFPQKFSPEDACIFDIEYILPYNYTVKYAVSHLISLDIDIIMKHFNDYAVIYYKSNSVDDIIYLTKDIKSVLDHLSIGTIQVSDHSRAEVLEYFDLEPNHAWPITLPSFDFESNKVSGISELTSNSTSYLKILIHYYNASEFNKLRATFVNKISTHNINALFASVPDNFKLAILVSPTTTHIFLSLIDISAEINEFIKNNQSYTVYAASSIGESSNIVTDLPGLNNMSIKWISRSGSDWPSFMYEPIFYHKFITPTTYSPIETDDKQVYEYSSVSNGVYSIVFRYLIYNDEFVQLLNPNANYLISKNVPEQIVQSFKSQYSSVVGYYDCKFTLPIVNVTPNGNLANQVDNIIDAEYNITTAFIFPDGAQFTPPNLNSVTNAVAIIMSDNEIKSLLVSSGGLIGLNDHILTLDTNKTYTIFTNITPTNLIAESGDTSIYYIGNGPNYQVMRFIKINTESTNYTNSYNDNSKYVIHYNNWPNIDLYTSTEKYIIIDELYLIYMNLSFNYLISKQFSQNTINMFKSANNIQELIYESNTNIQFMKYEPITPTLHEYDISGENALEEDAIIPYMQNITYSGYDAVIIGGGYSKLIPYQVMSYHTFISNVFNANNLPNYITIICSENSLSYGVDVVILSHTPLQEINSYINNYIYGQSTDRTFFVYANYELITYPNIIDHSRYLTWQNPIVSNDIYKYQVQFTIVTILNIN